MTREFNQRVNCPKCGCEHTVESSFQRWIRKNPNLDSSDGHVVSDLDFIIHRYMTPAAGRALQAMMFLEVKTNGSKPRPSQLQTLSIARQLIQNQHVGGRIRRVVNGIGGPTIDVRDYGGLLLRFSHTSPEDSDWIELHGKRIDTDTLTKVLRMDIDPITLKRIDWRQNHHHKDETLTLPLK